MFNTVNVKNKVINSSSSWPLQTTQTPTLLTLCSVFTGHYFLQNNQLSFKIQLKKKKKIQLRLVSIYDINS